MKNLLSIFSPKFDLSHFENLLNSWFYYYTHNNFFYIKKINKIKINTDINVYYINIYIYILNSNIKIEKKKNLHVIYNFMDVNRAFFIIFWFFTWFNNEILSFCYLLLLYFTFAGVSFLVLNFILNEWISLFTKSNIHLIISIFANFSDFGLYFILVLLFYYTVTDYITVVKSSFKNMINSTKRYFYDFMEQPELCALISIFIFFLVADVLMVTAIVKWPYVITVLYECKLRQKMRLLKNQKYLN